MVKIIPRDQIRHLEWNQEIQPISAPSTPETVAPSTPKSKVIHSIGSLTIDSLLESGEVFYDSDLPTALKAAQKYVGSGVVATMPYLIAGKAKSTKRNRQWYDRTAYLWDDRYTANTEEDIGIDSEGIYVSKGKPVLITLHGGGILTPELIINAYKEGLTSQNAAKLNQEDIDVLLQSGTLPSGDKITLYSGDDLQKGISDPFGRYAVILDFEKVKSFESRQFMEKRFLENPIVLARAGTKKYLKEYYEKAHNIGGVGNWHRLNEIDPNQAQGRLLFLDKSYNGLNGDSGLINYGRFVRVARGARHKKIMA